ncbi:MAG: acyl-CoA dehydratase activase-related protein [Coriobacteriia bacterium]|nr:acyl-CoA dehydratase activase-related protein [Coriobacteriia bacterium]
MKSTLTIGIPRALLYYTYADLWLNFFKNIGVQTVLSPETNKEIAKVGINSSIDEACYSSKIFIGHVEYLLDKCDMVFIPRIENSGIREEYCTRIFGLYDLAVNTFPQAKILHAEVNYLYRKREIDAFIQIGEQLGVSTEESTLAYQQAADLAQAIQEERILQQEKMLASAENAEDFKILMVAHNYNSFDAVIGKDIISYFEENNIKVAFADYIKTKEAKLKAKKAYSSRINWRVSLEMIGGIQKYKDYVDGLVLISTFPCGPDSLFSEFIIRTVKDKPILSLVLDEHDAGAGVQTRLESFIDIITAAKTVEEAQL